MKEKEIQITSPRWFTVPVLFFVLSLFTCITFAQNYPFQNPDQPLETRISLPVTWEM